MAYGAKVILDSISEAGVRLTTMEVTIPRIVLPEFNTHRMLSRNSASSRAIPVKKMIERVKADPFIPQRWGRNEKGMQANQELKTPEEIKLATDIWLMARDEAIKYVEMLVDENGINIHKQLANRLLEPWMWQTIIVTATEWENMRGLRVSPEAQPDFEIAARMLFEAYDASSPKWLDVGEWHLPYVEGVDKDSMLWDGVSQEKLIKISAARCARVSYLTHDGRRDPTEDVKLYDRLLAGPHLSPLEHPAQALANPIQVGNFTGWMQARKMIPGEAIHRGKK